MQFVVPLSLFGDCSSSPFAGETAEGISLLSLALALTFDPDLQRFHAIGHTQIYWPLLLCFTVLLASRRYTAAAVVLGLMVAARTTFVSIVPVFFLFLASRRDLTVRQIAAFVIAAAVPFLPFLIADPETLRYAMFGVYLKLMKGFVWYSTTWTQNTYGITGRLLERGLERYVELVQVVALLADVYALPGARYGAVVRPEPWLVLSLLVFSMTTLWPVASPRTLTSPMWQPARFSRCQRERRSGGAARAPPESSCSRWRPAHGRLARDRLCVRRDPSRSELQDR